MGGRGSSSGNKVVAFEIVHKDGTVTSFRDHGKGRMISDIHNLPVDNYGITFSEMLKRASANSEKNGTQIRTYTAKEVKRIDAEHKAKRDAIEKEAPYFLAKTNKYYRQQARYSRIDNRRRRRH